MFCRSVQTDRSSCDFFFVVWASLSATSIIKGRQVTCPPVPFYETKSRVLSVRTFRRGIVCRGWRARVYCRCMIDAMIAISMCHVCCGIMTIRLHLWFSRTQQRCITLVKVS
ncbi:unnamed protein product [Ectocarpus sp. 12 AP-2014]